MITKPAPTASAPSSPLHVVGRAVTKVDARALVTGAPVFAADMEMPDMLYGAVLHSPHAHAVINSIDASRALSLPGVRCVLTHHDLPPVRHSTAGVPHPEFAPYDAYVLDPHLRFVGDWVALVAADSEQLAEDALDLIAVDYETLPAVFDPLLAMAPGAPQLHLPDTTHPRFETRVGAIYDAARNLAGHEEIWRGSDFDAALARADLVTETEYRVQRVAHCALEPHVCIAHVDGYDRLNVITSTQVPYHTRRQLALALNLPVGRVRIIKPRVGGGFGSKQEMLLEPVAGALALATRRPVKVSYSRSEEFASSRYRHPMVIRVRSGFTNDGKLVALEMRTVADTGAYGTHGISVAKASGHKTLCLYRAEAYHFVADAVYTNSPVSGAFRGYGAPQGFFALESHLDEVARALSMDPVKLRQINHVRQGDEDPIEIDTSSGRPISLRPFQSCALPECISRGAELIGWDQPLEQPGGHLKRGRGVALAMQGSGVLGAELGGANIKLNEDGSFNLMTGATDIGQGSDTVLAQIAAEVLGVSTDAIIVNSSDTDVSVFDYGAYASSTTYVTGNGVRRAAQAVLEQILQVAADMLESQPSQLTIVDGIICSGNSRSDVCLADIAAATLYGPHRQQIMAKGDSWCQTSPPPFYAQFVEITVDLLTGQITVDRMINVIDLGRAINPALASGQVEGAVAMGLGYALTEEVKLDQLGRVTNPGFVDYKVFSCLDMPQMTTVLVESLEPTGPFGAKSCGEVPINGPAPAIANALFDATGIRLRQLPLTPERVLAALDARAARRGPPDADAEM